MKENVEKTSLFFNWIWQLKLGALRVKLYLSLSCHHKYSTVDGFNNRKNRKEFFTLWVDKHIQTNTNKVQQNSSKNTKLKKKTLKKSSKTRDQTKDDFDTLHNVSNRSTWTNEKSSIQKKVLYQVQINHGTPLLNPWGFYVWRFGQFTRYLVRHWNPLFCSGELESSEVS